MKIIENKLRDGVSRITICSDTLLFCDMEIARFDDGQLQELIVHLKKNRPELICPIMCEDCPEHSEQVEAHNYFHNLRETGGK